MVILAVLPATAAVGQARLIQPVIGLVVVVAAVVLPRF
jgi:hypothetical protein